MNILKHYHCNDLQYLDYGYQYEKSLRIKSFSFFLQNICCLHEGEADSPAGRHRRVQPAHPAFLYGILS
jgi:hypothetical protein